MPSKRKRCDKPPKRLDVGKVYFIDEEYHVDHYRNAQVPGRGREPHVVKSIDRAERGPRDSVMVNVRSLDDDFLRTLPASKLHGLSKYFRSRVEQYGITLALIEAVKISAAAMKPPASFAAVWNELVGPGGPAAPPI